MPLFKWFRGQRVKKSKRRGAIVLVKLAGRMPGDPPQWIAVSPREYEADLEYEYVHEAPRRAE